MSVNNNDENPTKVGDANTSTNWSEPLVPGKILPNNANKPKK